MALISAYEKYCMVCLEVLCVAPMPFDAWVMLIAEEQREEPRENVHPNVYSGLKLSNSITK